MSRDVFRELPNVKIGVTNTVHEKLRNLKKKGDTFNDVIDRLLPRTCTDKFDAVAEAYKSLETD